MGENTKAEAFLSYEKLKGDSEWMKRILPSEFWESDSKAFLKIHLHWKKPIYSSQDTVTRQTEFRIQMPRYIMTLNGYSLRYRGREQIIINLAKMDLNRGKLDAFLNATYDYWDNMNERYEFKTIHQVNVTIPQRSWSAMFEASTEGGKFQHAFILKRAVMKPVNGQKTHYVGWWNDEVSDRFRIDEHEVKLISNIEPQMWSSEDIANKFPPVSNEDLKGLSNSVYGSKVVLYYPFHDRIEKLDFDGYFIISKGDDTYRFQKTFDMTSTYNNLKLTSHSVFRTDDKTATLYHNSYFTHLTTETKAYNTIHFVWSSAEGRCNDIEFNHNIRSHVFDLSTEGTYKCESDVDGLHTLRLKINTNSSKWNMLDMKLEQVIENVSPDYTREEMTTIHALGTIHVDAEWTKLPYHHQKHVTLCSKDGNCPNAELFLEFRKRDWNVKFTRPDYEITCRSRLSADYKTLHVEVGYGNKESGESPVLDVTGEIIDPNFHVWKGALNRNSYNEVRDIFASGYKRFCDSYREITSDENHPLNVMLKPALKMPWYEYWVTYAEYLDIYYFTWPDIKEVFYTLNNFIEPAYSIFRNSKTTVTNLCTSVYDKLKHKSVAVWALDYFHIPYYIKEGITGLPGNITGLWKQLIFGEENVSYFKFVTGKIFSLRSFKEGPSIEFDPETLERLLPFKTPDSQRNENDKIGMVFGPSHVYTFDGHLYDVLEYPHEDCSYLLAHDVHKSAFTAFTSRNAIHLLFPEMSVSVDDQNEVYVNGSKVPSSLPIQSNNGKVTVKRDQVVEVWSPSLSVVCRSEDFLCTLKLSDYHAGGVIGLLGNADENPHNDFMLPNGNTTSSLVDYLRQYEISGKPECQALKITTSSSEASYEETEKCFDAFGSVCSKRLDVREKFLKSCYDDVRAGHGACFAAAGLSALCNQKYFPSHIKCNVKTQENVQIGRKLEVVFVVQETKYLTSTDKSTQPTKGIESLITAINSKFSEDGYDSIKYSVVGFGGNGVHYLPSIHSSKYSVWVNSSEIIDNVLKTLEFKSRQEADGVNALKYALEELGHDSFVSKVFIVMAAKDKQIADKSLVHYVRTLLEENGITLYTFSSYPSLEKGKKVFGVRADGLIFPSQTGEGDAYLDYPRGNLAKLTSSTRGSVYLTKFLRDNQPSSFFTEVAQEVWAKVSKEANQCRRCKHVQGTRWWYKNKCGIVHC